MTEKTLDLAKRVFEYTEPWNREDETVESTAQVIENDPNAIIEFLLDLLDNYQ